MSNELPVGPTILGKARGKSSKALNLPSSPSAAFSDFTSPFINKERGLRNESIELQPTIRELGIASFRPTDFRGPRGNFAKKAFKIDVKNTFGPHNLPTKKRNKFIGFDF